MIRATPDLTNAEMLDTSIMPDSAAVDHLIAMDAMAKGRTECACEFWTTPEGPEPNAVARHDGIYCGDCGGWMLDDE
jgi:hypothetical protein